MKITIEPTGHFEGVNGVRTRLWRGKTENGTEVECFIALVRARAEADNTELETALREVKGERELVYFDNRLAID